ncbi:MAG: transglycosylase SLT domain-containing protein [Rhodanobacter sp.]|jgi:membrane-bound lytic murein transglycosylase D
MKRQLRKLLLASLVLLAACSTVPSQNGRLPPSPKGQAQPIPAPVTTTPPADTVSPPLEQDLWDQLRGSFAMADCDADPAIMKWARQFTRNPQQFQNTLRQALPGLAYAQGVAAQYDVAGEFALLPWVESRFQPVTASHRRRPAGMWQIMPATARAMGLRVDSRYDGRLDMPAAAHAVMKMIRRYHDELHDWRLADYAYNAGEFSVRKLISKHGMPADLPTIPNLPVRNVTREHLAKLLAMACVIREPERFNVSLPELSDDKHLVKVDLPHSMPMARAADNAGISVETLKHLNAAYRGNQADASASSYLVLPADHAEQFRDALSQQAQTSTDGNSSADPIIADPAKANLHRTHVVRRGESLWQIARHYSVKVSQLQELNHLHGHVLKPGQVLQLGEVN